MRGPAPWGAPCAWASGPGPAASLVIRGARLLDPAAGIDRTGDLVVRDGVVGGDPDGLEEVDGRGLLVVPGFVDPHVHLRVPGREDLEDIATGSARRRGRGLRDRPRDAQHPAGGRLGRRAVGADRGGGARRLRPRRLLRRDHAGPAGRADDRAGRAGRDRSRRLLGRRPPGHQRDGAPPGPPVPAGHGPAPGAARGGALAVRARGDARGRGLHAGWAWPASRPSPRA